MLDVDNAIRKAWPVLHEAIRMRRTVTYTELAGRGGPPLNRRNLHRQILTPISERCQRAGLPDLSALVVRKDNGLPGQGWWVGRPGSLDPLGVWAEALEAVFAGPWTAEVDIRLLAAWGSPRGARKGRTARSR